MVDLSNNFISDYGISVLAQMILNNECIRELYLFNCCWLSQVGRELLDIGKESLKKQCQKPRAHSFILYCVFDESVIFG